MSKRRLAVKKIRDVLWYKMGHGMSHERIAGALGIGKGTVHNICERFRASGLRWPLPAELSDSALETMLYGGTSSGADGSNAVVLPDVDYLEKELRRPHVLC